MLKPTPHTQSQGRPASPPRRRAGARDAPKKSPDRQVPLASSLRPRGPALLELIERDDHGETHLLARGEVDVLTAPKLAATLVRVLHGAQGDVVVDLSETVFLDSAGLHVLLNAQRRLTRRNRKLRVVCGSGPVRRVIELARLVDTLNVADE